MSAHPVLIAYDGSPGADEAIRVASTLLDSKSVAIVNVTAPVAPTGVMDDLGGNVPAYMDDLTPTLERIGEETAERGAQLARDAGLTAEAHAVSVSTAWRGIVDMAETVDASLIVVGARGLTGIKSKLLGSTSEGVLHHTKRPVLIIQAPAED